MSTRVVERSVPRVSVARPGVLAGLWQTLDLWICRARTRRQLDALSDHELRDLGLDRGTAYRETIKPFWKG